MPVDAGDLVRTNEGGIGKAVHIDQIGQVIGAVEDVAETEGAPDLNVAEKRVEEAHDIIHRIAAILAMEEGRGGQDNVLREELWDGKLDGETIALAEDEEE